MARSVHAAGWHGRGGLDYLLDTRDAHRTRIAPGACVLINGWTAGLEEERQTLYVARVEAVLEATPLLPVPPPMLCMLHLRAARGVLAPQLPCRFACFASAIVRRDAHLRICGARWPELHPPHSLRKQRLMRGCACCVLQDPQGKAHVAIRYGWLMRDIVNLDMLRHPAVAPARPRQLSWQKEVCEDGANHVRGEIALRGMIIAACTKSLRSFEPGVTGMRREHADTCGLLPCSGRRLEACGALDGDREPLQGPPQGADGRSGLRGGPCAPSLLALSPVPLTCLTCVAAKANCRVERRASDRKEWACARAGVRAASPGV